MGHTYYTHDNGAYPFQVTVDDNLVKVSQITVVENVYKEIISLQCLKVFIGESPVGNDWSFPAGSCGSHDDGNTVLAQLSEDTYMFVGHEVSVFKSSSPIIGYTSMIGWCDCASPVATRQDGSRLLFDTDTIRQVTPLDPTITDDKLLRELQRVQDDLKGPELDRVVIVGRDSITWPD